MNTLDAGFYFVEHQNVPMHIGSLAVFEGPAPSYDDLLELYAAKLPQVPRYRQVVRTMPLQMLRPYWAGDVHFDLRYPLRHAGVAPPRRAGGGAGHGSQDLRVAAGPGPAAVGNLAPRRDRGRPLGDHLQGAPLHGRRHRRF